MKGQLVFEFIVAVVLFMGVVVYTLNTLNANVSAYTGDYFAMNMESKVVAASEAVLRTTEGAGVAKEWPVLDNESVNSLKQRCESNYVGVLNDLNLLERPAPFVGAEYYKVRILIEDGGSVVMDCSPHVVGRVPENIASAHVRRYGVLSGGVVEVNVWVW